MHSALGNKQGKDSCSILPLPVAGIAVCMVAVEGSPLSMVL